MGGSRAHDAKDHGHKTMVRMPTVGLGVYLLRVVEEPASVGPWVVGPVDSMHNGLRDHPQDTRNLQPKVRLDQVFDNAQYKGEEMHMNTTLVTVGPHNITVIGHRTGRKWSRLGGIEGRVSSLFPKRRSSRSRWNGLWKWRATGTRQAREVRR